MKKKLVIICILLLAIAWYAVYTYLHPVVTSRTTVIDRGKDVLSDESVVVQKTWYTITVLAEWLVVPRAVAQTSSDRLLVTERPGRVRQIVDGVLWADPLLTVSEISNKDEEWLMSLVLDPDYETNKYIYLCYAYKNWSTLSMKVIRYTDRGSELVEPVVIWDMLPAAQWHAWSALAFWPDRKLYITVGDATDANYAQSLDYYHGKILRVNSDGTVPTDNPFSWSAIWSYGHRNSQWIARTTDGEMYASEHGPSTFDGPPWGDELNHIVAGGNYWRPVVSHEEISNGMVSPLGIYTPAIAPASLMIYWWDMFPERKGNLFMWLLRGEGILQIVLDAENPDQIASTTRFIDDSYGRIRFVGQWIDGSIYFTTSNEDGRGKSRPWGDKVYQIKR